MARKYPGLYLYFDWLKGLIQLPPEIGMKIIENLYYYAQDGREPEPLDNVAHNLLQEMYLDGLKRAQTAAENGRHRNPKPQANIPSAIPAPIMEDDFYDDYITPEEELEAIDRELQSLMRQKQRLELSEIHPGFAN